MKRFIVAILVVAALAALLIWRFATKAEAAKILTANAPGRQAVMVKLSEAVARDIETSVETVGSIDTPFNVHLSPNVAGPITYLNVREGDEVTPKDVLVKIDPSALQAAYDAAKATEATNLQRYVQAKYTQDPNNVAVTAGIEEQQSAVAAGRADYGQIVNNEKAQVQQADQVVVDNENKVRSAASNIETMKANLNSANANYNDAKVKDSRYEVLYKQGFIAAQDLDDQRAAVEVAKANVGVAQANLDAANSALTSAKAELAAAKKARDVVALQAKSNIAASKSKLDQAISALKLAVANRGNIPSYVANLKALKATYDSSVSATAQAKANLAYTVLRSPIAGVVTARTADPGNIAQPGTPVLTIQQLNWVYLTSQVPVEYSADIHVGQEISFSVDAIPGQTFTAKISHVDPSADPLSRQFLIRCTVDNPPPRGTAGTPAGKAKSYGPLRPGMFARLKMTTSVVRHVVTVPREAVTIGPNNYNTVVIATPATGADLAPPPSAPKGDAAKGTTPAAGGKQYIAHVVEVTLGASDTRGYQILDGVKAGDLVVTQSYSPIADKKKIRTAAPGEADPGAKPSRAGAAGPGSGRSGAGSSGGGASAGAAAAGGTGR